MRMHAIRLKEGDDLRQRIIDFILAEQLSSAAIVSVVGSLSIVKLRMAGAKPDHQDIREYNGSFEIVSLVGTVTSDGSAHMHMSVSDSEGIVVGGHLKDGSIVHTTAEVVIAGEESLLFTRKIDEDTGFDELQIKQLEG